MSTSLIDRVRERLAAESAPLRPNVVADAIRAESGGLLGDTEVLSSLRLLQTELTGAGILEPLLFADGTTDVLVTAPDAVWVDDGNGLRRSSIRFNDEAEVRRLAQRLALAAGRRLDEAQPWVDGQLTGLGAGDFSVRLHAVLPPIAAGGTCLSLRVLRPATQDLAALMRTGAIEPPAAALVDDIIGARLAFLVSGGTGAGKTTLLAAVLGAVPADERIVCVEDAAELAPA
ncbi:MAG TPA: ATPase, T2SS/T4P/T4SS family, partial [Mycobacterium sp.]|nr:ATPase, T2SS/T4P/T4SS family [Mycobacterium sp.]